MGRGSRRDDLAQRPPSGRSCEAHGGPAAGQSALGQSGPTLPALAAGAMASPGLRFPFAPCKPRVPTNRNLPDCPWWVPRGPTKPRAPGTGWAAQRPHLGAGEEPLPVESPAPSAQLPSPVCRCELGWGRRCTSRRVGGGGSRGKRGLPAISFSKNGWMSCPYLEFPATASFSSCPQQTGGENAGKTPLNFQKAGG